VLSVHRCFGFARQVGQWTDNICRNVSFSVATTTIIQYCRLQEMVNCALLIVLATPAAKSGNGHRIGISIRKMRTNLPAAGSFRSHPIDSARGTL
jgi:hypothetical protein